MSKFINDLLAGAKQATAESFEDDPMTAYASIVAKAKRVGKTPVEQEFPGLVHLTVLPNFMPPGMVFYHEPSGYVIYAGLSLFPGMTPLGREWLAAPVLIRYPATQRFDKNLAIEALRSTYMQSVALPIFGTEVAKVDGLHYSMRLIMGDESSAQEIAEGIFECYCLVAIEATMEAANDSVKTIKSLLSKFIDNDN
jgi:hypothetical protein